MQTIYDYIETLWSFNGSWYVIKSDTSDHWKTFLVNGLDYHPSQLFALTDGAWQLNTSAYSISEEDVDNFIACCDELDRNKIKE